MTELEKRQLNTCVSEGADGVETRVEGGDELGRVKGLSGMDDVSSFLEHPSIDDCSCLETLVRSLGLPFWHH